MYMDTNEIGRRRGGTVVGPDGEKIGSIDEIYLDRQTGQPEWLAVKTGMFGTKLTFVPLAQAEATGEGLRVPYDKAQVKDAPNVEPDGELSEEEEARLYRHYGLQYGQSTPAVGRDVSGPETDDAMTRSEEELRVGTRSLESGRLRLRKWIESEPVETTVQTRRDVPRIEREPITDANREAAMSGGELTEEEHEVTLYAEEPVVEKRVVPKERVRATTDSVMDETEVREEIRKERIEVDGDADRHPSR
jgi:stress response protein YsnF